MASLNHVCMWSEHGWIRITAEQASAMHPGGTVSAHSGLFMCELCGQYVTLTDGDIRDRYFKHSAHEANKNCPERTFGASYTPTYNPGEHELPLKLVVVSNTNFRLELGLLCVPSGLLSRQKNKSVTIKTTNGKQFVFSFERLNEDTITYLPVGSDPVPSYSLDTSNELAFYWPRRVRGVPEEGALFDAATGKMVPIDADVQICKKYYLLTPKPISWSYKSKHGINGALRCEERIGWCSWKVYEIEASELNEYAAKFFLEYHCRLTDIPMEIRLIWPIHVETPYLIKHNSKSMIMHLTGNRQISPKAFPYAYIQTTKCAGRGQAIKVNCQERQQLISAGNANVLQYLYLWREPLPQITPAISLTVSDVKNNEISVGEHNAIPEDALIRVEAPFDGEIRLLRGDEIIEILPIFAHKWAIVDSLYFGLSVQILQGLDVVWSCSFVKVAKDTISLDSELHKKLISFKGNDIPVPHSFGNVVRHLNDYPKTKQWVFKAIRRGHASEKAVSYLKEYYIQSLLHKKESLK